MDIWQRPYIWGSPPDQGAWSIDDTRCKSFTQVGAWSLEGPGGWAEITQQYTTGICVLIPDQYLLHFDVKHFCLKQTTQHILMCERGASRTWRAMSWPPHLERGLIFPMVTVMQVMQGAFVPRNQALHHEKKLIVPLFNENCKISKVGSDNHLQVHSLYTA